MLVYLDDNFIEFPTVNNTEINFTKNFNLELVDVVISSEPSLFIDFIKSENKTFILYAHEKNIDNLEILKKYNINHILGKSDIKDRELGLILQKLFYKNIFGIEKHLGEDAIIFSEEITHSKDISEKIELLINRINVDDTFDSPKDNLRVVLNELATNAFFHQEDLLDTNRKNSIFTSFNNSIILRIGRDDTSIIVYVKDNIGLINKNTLLDSIERGYVEKTPRVGQGGAGLGLYMVYENLNQLHINKKKDQFCEFIGIIEVNKRYKKFKERVTSFHFFEE